MREVEVVPADLERLAALLPPERAGTLQVQAQRARDVFGDRVVWHVSSTASGGGVAEMLHTLLAYASGAGVRNRWVVIEADGDFFTLTKRLHNLLHGVPTSDVGSLGGDDRRVYRKALEANLDQLRHAVAPGDIVLLHDPQTAGLAQALSRQGALVLWRCHIGRDTPNESTSVGWEFLREHLSAADALVFSRAAYAPSWADPDRVRVIPPSIDPFSPKNVDLSPGVVVQILGHVGLLAGPAPTGPIRLRRRDGSPLEIRRHPEGRLLPDGPPPPVDCDLVVQVSRWDRLKDMAGVIKGFAIMLDRGGPAGPSRVDLMLVGPATSAVADDPEGAAVLTECRDQWARLPDRLRQRIHLAVIPMDDPDENALIVNAVQRQARVVVQKSLAEGFGLTVAEAMWKSRATLASRVGGIQDQIQHGVNGLLLDDPADLDAFAAQLHGLLADAPRAGRLGAAARERVLDQYIGDRHLERYVDLFVDLVQARPRAPGP